MSTFNGTHSIEIGVGGSYVILRDTTTDSEYIAATGSSISQLSFASGSVVITNQSGTVNVSHSITSSEFASTRTGPGLKLTSLELINSSAFIDDMYEVTFTVNLTRGISYTRVSSNPVVLYGVTQLNVMKAVISTAWKIVYSNKNPYYDNSLKLKSWLDNMKIASDLGFYSESLRLLNALKKVLV